MLSLRVRDIIMAELPTVRAVLNRFGVQLSDGDADTDTIAWITDRAGLDRASVFNAMFKTDMEQTFKRLAKEAEDPGVDNGGRVPDGQIPEYNLRVTRAIQQVTMGE